MTAFLLRIEPAWLIAALSVPIFLIILACRMFAGPNPFLKECDECGQIFRGEGIYCDPCCLDLANWYSNRAPESDYMRERK
jgi:hypothetical protein